MLHHSLAETLCWWILWYAILCSSLCDDLFLQTVAIAGSPSVFKTILRFASIAECFAARFLDNSLVTCTFALYISWQNVNFDMPVSANKQLSMLHLL